jgi:glycosyltransferase involved in cell wall biosynthesis
MAAKKAVVATDIPGVREVVSDGQTGLLVKPREPTELGAAMIRLTADEFRRKLANAAYERVLSEFNIDTTAAAYEELYQEVAP